MEIISNNNRQFKISPIRKVIYQFLSIFFRYLYNEMAWSYDWVASIVSIGRWTTWTETTIPYLSGLKILELGHGTGHLITSLLQSDKQAVGIDLSPYMGNIASSRLKKAQLHVNLANAQAQHLPFKREYFDHVVATFPTEYILDEKTLSEIYRVLKPAGSAVILPVAWITGKGLADRLASWLFRTTGQSPQWDDQALDPAIRAGFDVRTERISLRSSQVLIVIAEKKAPD